MGRARRWAGEVTCDILMTGKLSAVACAAKESTTCQICIPLVGLRQRRRLAVHLLLEREELLRCELKNHGGASAVPVIFQAAQPPLLAGGHGMYRNTDLTHFVTFKEISAT